MPKRRKLHFNSLDDVRQEAESLLKEGYRRAGNWSLGTMCDHLGRAMKYSCEGFPRTWPRAIQWVFRAFGLPQILSRKVFSWRFPAPIRVNWQVSDQEGFECLVRGIERFQHPEGPVFPHILLGKLTREEWLQFHLWHCEHHVSFLLPLEELPNAQPAGSTGGLP